MLQSKIINYPVLSLDVKHCLVKMNKRIFYFCTVKRLIVYNIIYNLFTGNHFETTTNVITLLLGYTVMRYVIGRSMC